MRRTSQVIGDGAEWATVYVAANPFEAELVRGLLDEESIPTLRQSDLSASLWGRPSGLRILVPRSDEAAARELIRAYQGRDLKVINLADYLPARRSASRRLLLERLLPLLVLPIVILIVFSLVLVVAKW